MITFMYAPPRDEVWETGAGQASMDVVVTRQGRPMQAWLWAAATPRPKARG
jgi:hypothetical protein